jgi:hypothetical protein
MAVVEISPVVTPTCDIGYVTWPEIHLGPDPSFVEVKPRLFLNELDPSNQPSTSSLAKTLSSCPEISGQPV